MTDVASAIKSVVQAAIGDVDEVILNALPLLQVHGVDKVSCAHLDCPCFFVRVCVYCDNAGRLHKTRSLNNTKTDCTTSEDRDRRSLCQIVSNVNHT